ncbi:non-specific lipid transfer protein GPI-anchored 1 [Neltuma alba]|uniref:non-specific lipid transfer protein GPI-anchored 1-like n=1 Tax=Neltuma alba TaxID=207710 RepID=UPI0010A35EB2|nr:non-specific lipid transfer protein GPI-anchored 1-like [Prosopis alba]XP_028771928.1 non-specific lipid transfer protein GPI-anchored 1-like [Prosopis alba]XP_028789121.1 non-specific lipid transfer protein GPI-anchored 1-like [Prosopis alba]XP_028789122.1 non-specific lipid transfer protein GPI-anchored 1-like [Prosopis alba]
MEHKSLSLCLILSLSLVLLGGPVAGAEDLVTKCGQVVQKVMPCLTFATGQAAVPTKQCCDAAASIKESSPECMCYVIQQTHKGNAQSKSLGIQEAKLLQLPSACKLNANISHCPELLGLPANSPDAAIFKNTNSSSAAMAPGGAADAKTNSSSSTSPSGSIGSTLQPPFFADVLAVALAVLLVAFPASGFLSVFT